MGTSLLEKGTAKISLEGEGEGEEEDGGWNGV